MANLKELSKLLDNGWNKLDGEMTVDKMLRFVIAWTLIAIAESLEKED